MTSHENMPSEQAIMTAYQVTTRVYISESQLIWRRTGLFIALNSLVAAVLHYVGTLPEVLNLLIPVLGCAYAVCWHISMKRMWQYHQYYIRLMREQEKALGLERLGSYSRGQKIVEGTSDLVDGEETRFTPATLIFRAKFLADVTTWLFFGVYLFFVVQYFLP